MSQTEDSGPSWGGGGSAIYDRLIKHPQLSPTKPGWLELNAHSLTTALEDIIITESSCKHASYCTNNSEMGQWVPKLFGLLMWYQWQNGNVFIVTLPLCGELQSTPTAFMSGACANISFTLVKPHNEARSLFYLESNMQSPREAANLSFTLSGSPQKKCWKWHVVSTVTLITGVNAARKNLKASSLQPLISLKDCTFDCALEFTAWLQTHFTLCLNQFTLPDPVIKKSSSHLVYINLLKSLSLAH